MIPPVSVCHQLSWMGSPSASWPQTTASGFSGSPTLATNRRADRSRPSRRARPGPHQHPDRGRRRVPDGDRCSSRIRYQRSASNSASSTIIVTPCVSGATIPYEVPVTHPGRRCTRTRRRVQVEREPGGGVVGDDRVVDVDRALRAARRAAGEVQQRRVLGVGRTDRELGRCRAPSAGRGRGPLGSGGAVASTISTCSSVGQLGRGCRRPCARTGGGVVTSTRPCPELSRCRIGSGPNAENSGDTTARVLQRPEHRHVQLGDRPSSRNTRSPGLDAEVGRARWRTGSSRRRRSR
jgi:hypothetical protein